MKRVNNVDVGVAQTSQVIQKNLAVMIDLYVSFWVRVHRRELVDLNQEIGKMMTVRDALTGQLLSRQTDSIDFATRIASILDRMIKECHLTKSGDAHLAEYVTLFVPRNVAELQETFLNQQASAENIQDPEMVCFSDGFDFVEFQTDSQMRYTARYSSHLVDMMSQTNVCSDRSETVLTTKTSLYTVSNSDYASKLGKSGKMGKSKILSVKLIPRADSLWHSYDPVVKCFVQQRSAIERIKGRVPRSTHSVGLRPPIAHKLGSNVGKRSVRCLGIIEELRVIDDGQVMSEVFVYEPFARNKRTRSINKIIISTSFSFDLFIKMNLDVNWSRVCPRVVLGNASAPFAKGIGNSQAVTWYEYDGCFKYASTDESVDKLLVQVRSTNETAQRQPITQKNHEIYFAIVFD